MDDTAASHLSTAESTLPHQKGWISSDHLWMSQYFHRGEFSQLSYYVREDFGRIKKNNNQNLPLSASSLIVQHLASSSSCSTPSFSFLWWVRIPSAPGHFSRLFESLMSSLLQPSKISFPVTQNKIMWHL